MKPRLKSSKKWTPVPQDVIIQIQELFKENFHNELQNMKIIAEGKIYPEEILLRVGHIEEGRLTQYNFEVSMPYQLTKEDSALIALTTCVDAIGSLMAEYFDKGEEAEELPYSWTESLFDGKKIWIQHSAENSNLEKEANQLLGLDEKKLLYEEESEEDVELMAEDDLEDLEDSDSDEDPDDSSGSGKGPLH